MANSWIAPDMERFKRHLRYLDRLIRIGRSHDSKRADWLKFCHVCGADISTTARGVRTCEGCNRAAILAAHTAIAHRERNTRARWRKRIAAVAVMKILGR